MAFEAAVAASALSSHTYSVNLLEQWCIGSVPNGGYVASVLQAAAQLHFKTTLSKFDQPDAMAMQLQFIRRTSVGPAIVSIKDVKLGSRISTIHATLSQNGRDEVEGYLTHTNLSKEEGLTLTTSYKDTGVVPPPLAADLNLLEQQGEDEHWIFGANPPMREFRKAMQHMKFYRPKHQPDPSIVDQWVRFCPDGKESVPFTNEALGFVVDMFQPVVEQYPKPKGEIRWYPTVALNVDIKRKLPPHGADWLFLRARAAEIRDGRLDLQVVVLDAAGNLVALSSHINLVLSAERNLAGRQAGKL